MIKSAVVTNDLGGQRGIVVEYLSDKQPKPSVIDVGGAMGSHFDSVVTHYMDWNESETSPGKHFKANLSDYEDWNEIRFHVDTNGKFDFAICTQTLEDIQSPMVVLKMLPRIAKKGYIDIPSKYLELKFGNERPDDNDRPIWGLEGFIMGYSGHRWIMNMIDDVLWLFPKLPFIEHLTGLDWWDKENPPGYHYCFWWEDSIPFQIVNNDFLGPNPPSIYHVYREGLRRGM